MKIQLFRPNRDAVVSRIKEMMPECQHKDAQDIANKYQEHLRTGFNWIRVLKVLLLMMSFGVLSIVIAWLLAIAGIQLPKPLEYMAVYGFMCINGLWMWIVMRWESRKCFTGFLQEYYPQHADYQKQVAASDGETPRS